MSVSIRGACAWLSLACFGNGSRRVCNLWLTSVLPAGQLGPKLLRGGRDVGICGNLQAHHGDAALCACRARGGGRGQATPHRVWLSHAAGAQLHNGRRHQEIVSEVSGERISSLTGGSYRVAQRHATIKRSDCWVTFWSFEQDGQKRRMKRQTGSFREVEDYPPENRFRPVPYGATVGQQTGRHFMAQIDSEAAACRAAYDRVIRSFRNGINSEEDRNRHVAIVEEMNACMWRRAEALDKTGFLGKWYSAADDLEHLFAVVDGKLHIRKLR